MRIKKQFNSVKQIYIFITIDSEIKCVQVFKCHAKWSICKKSPLFGFKYANTKTMIG